MTATRVSLRPRKIRSRSKLQLELPRSVLRYAHPQELVLYPHLRPSPWSPVFRLRTTSGRPLVVAVTPAAVVGDKGSLALLVPLEARSLRRRRVIRIHLLCGRPSARRINCPFIPRIKVQCGQTRAQVTAKPIRVDDQPRRHKAPLPDPTCFDSYHSSSRAHVCRTIGGPRMSGFKRDYQQQIIQIMKSPWKS